MMMTRHVAPTFLGALICAASLCAQPENDIPVRVTARIEMASAHAGRAMDILVSVVPADGYHVTADPPVDVVLDSADHVVLEGDAEIGIDSTSGYLDTLKEIRQRIRTLPAAPAGTMRFRGSVVLYVYSDAEGWCRRFRLPFQMSLLIER
jgi:hypothetical protein